MHKIRTHHLHPHGKVLSYLALLMGFGIGLILPIFPNFVKTIMHTDTLVSIFYSAMAIIMFIGALLSTYLFKKYQKTTIVTGSLLTLIVGLFLFIFITRLPELVMINTIRVWFSLFLLMALALFVRDFANEKNLGKEEGLFYKYQNIGYLLGPLTGGFLASSLNYEVVFLLASAVFMIGLFYFHHLHIVQKHPAIIPDVLENKFSLIANIKKFFSNKKRTKAYLMTIAAMTFLGFKRLYIPLYVVTSGYFESMTGMILAAGILPYIFLEVKVGEYADKHGVKLPASLGFAIIAISLIIIFISPFTLFNFFMLIVMNIGGALVEPLQELYLFKNLPKKEEDSLYGIYMTADPIAHFLTPTIGVLILMFLPFNYLFLVFGVFLLLASGYFHLTLRN